MNTIESPLDFLSILAGFLLLLSNNAIAIVVGILMLVGGLLAPFYRDTIRDQASRIFGYRGKVQPLINSSVPAVLEADIPIESRWRVELSNDLIQLVIISLGSNNSNIRDDAAKALVNIGAPAVEPLISAVSSPNLDIRRSAVEVLEAIGDSRAIEPLISVLEDKDIFVRRIAVRALGHFSEKRVVEALIAALRHGEPGDRGDVAKALVNIGAPAVEPLISLLSTQDADIPRLATFALGEIADSRAVEPLINLLQGADSLLHSDIIKALVALGDTRALVPLSSALRSEEYAHTRLDIVASLGKMGEIAIEPLVSALIDKDSRVRESAAELLAQIGKPAVEPLASLLVTSKNLESRRLAYSTLARIDSNRAGEVLSEIGGDKGLGIGLIKGRVPGAESHGARSKKNNKGGEKLA